jgi:hypothetical protein
MVKKFGREIKSREFSMSRTEILFHLYNSKFMKT